MWLEPSPILIPMHKPSCRNKCGERWKWKEETIRNKCEENGSHACTLSVFSHGMYSVSSINFRLGLSERIELPGLYSWIQVLKH